jgi:molecular chaperone DnaJ
MAAKRDYYEVLGVQRTATEDEIGKAYRRLATRFHPDRNPGDDEAAEKFKEASEAFEVLSSAEKRQRYDRYGHAGVEGSAGNFNNVNDIHDFLRNSGFGDILNEFFGGRGGFGGAGGPRRGPDLEVQMDLTLQEAFAGVRKTVAFAREEPCGECKGSGAKPGSRPSRCRRCDCHGGVIAAAGFFQVQRTCPSCGGRGEIITDPCTACRSRGKVEKRHTVELSIPPGVDSGMTLRVSGEGGLGPAGAPRGDLHVAIRVRKHSIFRRESKHLICEVPITISQAALGAEIEVPTLRGPVAHQLPRGIQSGERIQLDGLGMPDVHGGRPGDLHVFVKVETPRTLTKRQEELFRELAELDHKHVSPERKTFFDRVRNFFTGGEAAEKETKEAK